MILFNSSRTKTYELKVQEADLLDNKVKYCILIENANTINLLCLIKEYIQNFVNLIFNYEPVA